MTKSQQYPLAPVVASGKALARKLASKTQALAVDRSGSTAVEYALVSGGIGAAISGGLSFVGTGISEIFETLSFALCRLSQIVCLM